MHPLTQEQVLEFHELGYTVIRNAADSSIVKDLRTIAEQQLTRHSDPLELEADVKYPGAPGSRDEPGGRTERRLLQAYQRHQVFRDWAANPLVSAAIRQLLECEELRLNLNHHNCIMTKQPEFSSETLWHRDTRYWRFDNGNLVNAWLALGDEAEINGGMKALPGSQRWDIPEEDLDEAEFLLPDSQANRKRISTAVIIELNAGDLLLFNANVFHAAGQNRSATTKFSLVYTYHGPDTHPQPGTRSANLEEVSIRLTR